MLSLVICVVKATVTPASVIYKGNSVFHTILNVYIIFIRQTFTTKGYFPKVCHKRKICDSPVSGCVCKKMERVITERFQTYFTSGDEDTHYCLIKHSMTFTRIIKLRINP